MASPPATSTELSPSPGPDWLVDRLWWLSKMRWMAVCGVLLVIGVTVGLELLDTQWELLLTAGVLALGNLAFRRYFGTRAEDRAEGRLEDLIVVQLLFDVAILSALLHFSGGGDNPFGLIYVLPMAIAGMTLPLKKALFVAGAATLCHGVMLFGELGGLLEHHELHIGGHAAAEEEHGSLLMSPIYVSAYLGGFVTTMAGVVYFVHSVTRQLRLSEVRRAAHERVALSRERLARIGELSAGVAHSIRNPLHGLGNCIDLLGRRVDTEDEEVAEILELMQEASERIGNVTDRLLALAREGPMSREAHDLADVAREAMDVVSLRASTQGVRVVLESPEPAVVQVEPISMVEAVANVVDNAVQASPRGGLVRLDVGLGPSPNTIRLDVRDEGPGIPDDAIEKVFHPFFTTKAVGEGTGLGLAIARRILEEHGGDIGASSRLEAGAHVWLELPAAQVARPDMEVG
jgi:signal transduction histidine kinase